MARSRHLAPMPSSSSSSDLEGNTPIMVVRRDHRRSGSSYPATRPRRSLPPRCRGACRAVVRTAGAIACLAAVAIVVVGPRASSPRGAANDARDDYGGGAARSKEDDPRTAELLLLDELYRLPLPTTHGELDDLNDEFRDLDPALILRWAGRRLLSPQRQRESTHPLIQVTSFGPTGLVILHLLSETNLLRDVPIVTMDTLHLFRQSYDYYDTVRSHFEKRGMNLVVTKPVIDRRDEFDSAYGPQLWRVDPDLYAKLTKVDPLRKVLEEWQVRMWITGRRRSSGGERKDLNVLEFEHHNSYDGRDEGGGLPFGADKGRWKLNPLAYWKYSRVWEYIRHHHLPYNVLYDEGYTSIGDEMNTGLPRLNASSSGANLDVDEFERSGRFFGTSNRTECGLHSHRRKVDRMKLQALGSGKELSPPTLKCDKCIDLNVSNFASEITSGDHAHGLLVEFYSPWCGGCQKLAPTVDRIANHLSIHDPELRVARFDVTHDEIPRLDGKELFRVEGTPTLYRVLRSPSFQVELYKGGHDFDSILGWLTKTLEDPSSKRKHAILRRTERGKP